MCPSPQKKNDSTAAKPPLLTPCTTTTCGRGGDATVEPPPVSVHFRRPAWLRLSALSPYSSAFRRCSREDSRCQSPPVRFMVWATQRKARRRFAASIGPVITPAPPLSHQPASASVLQSPA